MESIADRINLLKKNISLINMPAHFPILEEDTIAMLNAKYVINHYTWGNREQCYDSLEERDKIARAPILCIIFLDEKSCETYDIIKLLYDKHHCPILVLNNPRGEENHSEPLAMQISYIEAGAVGYITVYRYLGHLNSVIEFLLQGHGLFQWQSGDLMLLRYTTLQRQLSPLTLQILEMLCDRELVGHVDGVTEHHYDAMETMLLEELGLRCLSDTIPWLVEASATRGRI